MKRAAAVLALSVPFVACAATPRARSTARPSGRTTTADAATAEPLPSFESLASAPAAMKEHTRADLPADGRLRLSFTGDTCLRASVAGIDLVRAWFEDETGPRGAAVSDAGLVPPKGPVCVRAGETISLVVEARAARAIVWRSL
jgi:hypothetical protein